MANMLQHRRVLRNLFSSRQTAPFDFASLEITPFDIDSTYAGLNLANEAERNGKAEIPATDDKEFDGPQQKIVSSTETRIQPALAQAEVTLKGLSDQISRVNLEPHLRQLRQAPDQCREKLKRGLSDASSQIALTREAFHASLEEYETFRRERNIDRRPVYPERHAPHILTIVFILLCETACNAYFFARGADYGYVGGAAQAFVLALVDVLIVFCLGRCIPWTSRPISF